MYLLKLKKIIKLFPYVYIYPIMTTDINNTLETNDGKWKCPHCLKWFKKSYKYKNHLSRCLVHNDHLDTKYSLMGDLMTDLKQELMNDFKHQLSDLLTDIKNEVKNNVKTNNYQVQPKKLIYPF